MLITHWAIGADIVKKLTYYPPSIKVNNGLKMKGKKFGHKVTTQKRHIFTP